MKTQGIRKKTKHGPIPKVAMLSKALRGPLDSSRKREVKRASRKEQGRRSQEGEH